MKLLGLANSAGRHAQSSGATVQFPPEKLEHLEPMGREALEILDYSNDQTGVDIKRIERRPVDDMTYTPEWIPFQVTDKKTGNIKIEHNTNIIEEPVKTKYMEVIAQIGGSKQTTLYNRRIRLQLTDHFLAPKGVPYSFSLEDTKESGVQDVGAAEMDDDEDEEDEEAKQANGLKQKEGMEEAKQSKKSIAKTQNKSKKGCFDIRNKMRKMVSQKKVRFAMKDWDLDLTYITNRIIACGFPATGLASTYRNSKADLVDFFQAHHGKMLKVYNLCAEENMWYDQKSIKPFSISKFCFPDHNVCNLKRMFDFCLDVALFLQRMEQYVHKLKQEGGDPCVDL